MALVDMFQIVEVGSGEGRRVRWQLHDSRRINVNGRSASKLAAHSHNRVGAKETLETLGFKQAEPGE